jgi:hypothetical protein
VQRESADIFELSPIKKGAFTRLGPEHKPAPRYTTAAQGDEKLSDLVLLLELPLDAVHLVFEAKFQLFQAHFL